MVSISMLMPVKSYKNNYCGQSVRPGAWEVQLSGWPGFLRSWSVVVHMRIFSLLFPFSPLQWFWVFSRHPRLNIRFTPWRQDCSKVSTRIWMMEQESSGGKGEPLRGIPELSILKSCWSEGSSRRESDFLCTRILGGHSRILLWSPVSEQVSDSLLRAEQGSRMWILGRGRLSHSVISMKSKRNGAGCVSACL